MKTKCPALAVCLFVQLTARAQALPTKKEQYDFLKWYIKSTKPKSLSNIIIPFDENMVALGSIKLNNSNVKYLKKQLGAYTDDALLDTAILKGNYWSVKPDTTRSTISLSLPIFSINKKIVAIHLETRCGWECGGDHIEVYEKNKAGQ
jgi:hypothetical protein